MIIDGKKLACATCIKGHRASHCKHKDRPLIEIKKKGRPATQCKRCRELRTVRQLHVKCDCNDELDSAPRKKRALIPSDKIMKEKLNLRLIAPKPEQQQQQQPASPSLPKPLSNPLPSQHPQSVLHQSPPQQRPLESQPLSSRLSPRQQYIPEKQAPTEKQMTAQLSSPPAMSCGSSNSSCCSNGTSSPIKQSNDSTCCSSASSFTASTMIQNNDTLNNDSNCCSSASLSTTSNAIQDNNTLNNKSSGCGCGSGSKDASQQQKVGPSRCGRISKDPGTTEVNRVRVITCRCGDSCACPGCDAHPSRAMKGQNDPYTGFTTEDSRRRLSIASICLPSDVTASKRSEQPTAVLNENGVELCGCGCSQTLDSCSSCFRELCQDYYSNVSTS